MKNSPIKSDFDVIVGGGGAAGISAALWCDELGLKTLLLEKNSELGGQLLRVYNQIKNHLGAQAENGEELRDIFVKQIEDRNFTTKLSSAVSEIDCRTKTLTLESGEEFNARAIILATGVSRRKLNVAGEEKFEKKGIIESGKRDRNFAKNKKVAVVGGGDAALENALILSETAASVALIHRNRDFRARAEFVERVKNNPKIEIFTDSIVQKLGGSEQIETAEIRNRQTGETRILLIEAALIRIGVEPNTKFLRGQIALNKSSYIKVDRNCETDVDEIFAVGDVANPHTPTISSAVGMGATAAKVIASKLTS